MNRSSSARRSLAAIREADAFMIAANAIFDEAAIELARALEPHGFRVSERIPPPDSFGHRLLGYRRGTEGVRLIWDGREEWFLLQQSSGVLDGEPPWTDLVWERYDPQADPSARVAEIPATLNLAIKHLR
jgi:hypothetical protein